MESGNKDVRDLSLGIPSLFVLRNPSWMQNPPTGTSCAGRRLKSHSLLLLGFVRVTLAVGAIGAVHRAGRTRVSERADVMVPVGKGLLEYDRRLIALLDDVYVIDGLGIAQAWLLPHIDGDLFHGTRDVVMRVIAHHVLL
jgi:hypothetical protein